MDVVILVFILIPIATRYNVISKTYHISPKNVSMMSLNNKHYPVFNQLFNKFTNNFISTFVYLHYYYLGSSDTPTSVNVRMSIRFRASIICMLSSLLKILIRKLFEVVD